MGEHFHQYFKIIQKYFFEEKIFKVLAVLKLFSSVGI